MQYIHRKRLQTVREALVKDLMPLFRAQVGRQQTTNEKEGIDRDRCSQNPNQTDALKIGGAQKIQNQNPSF